MNPTLVATDRLYNFSAGPAVLPLPVLEEAQRDLVALPGVGMSVMEISHRSKPFDEIIQGAEADMRALGRHSGQLQGAVPAGRREPAVLDGADEPARAGRDGRLHRHGRLGEEGAEGSEAKSARRTSRRRPRAATSGAFRSRPRSDAHAGRRLRAHDVEQHDLRHRVAIRAGRRRRAARLRRVVGHLLPADRRLEVRADLRGRAEEPRTVRCHGRHRARGPARALGRRRCRRC